MGGPRTEFPCKVIVRHGLMHSKQQCMSSICSPWQHHLLLFCPALSCPMTDDTESAGRRPKGGKYDMWATMTSEWLKAEKWETMALSRLRARSHTLAKWTRFTSEANAVELLTFQMNYVTSEHLFGVFTFPQTRWTRISLKWTRVHLCMNARREASSRSLDVKNIWCFSVFHRASPSACLRAAMGMQQSSNKELLVYRMSLIFTWVVSVQWDSYWPWNNY